MALAADTRPHFTTIAQFISSMGEQITSVFAHTRHTLGMDRFMLRGRAKVDIQWKLYCVVHNIAKIQRYATV